MSKLNNENLITLETLVSIFTVEKGTFKILLKRKSTDPYKGYWVLPGKILNNQTTLEENTDSILNETIGTTKIYIEQNFTFSKIDREPNERVLATTYIGLIDSKTNELKNKIETTELQWFPINELPKIGYDNKEIIDYSIEKLKIKLNNITIIKNLFPSDFTLPELQNIYESIMNLKLDRRNFRKKFINLGLIEDTGYKSEGGSGRPAKLYRFKDDLKEINIF